MGEPAKYFIKYVGANTIGMVATAICIIADYWFIAAAMGTEGLAALSMGLPAYSITWGIGVMLGVGGGAKYAEYQATEEEAEANQVFAVTMKLGLIAVIPLVLSGIFFGVEISMLFGAEGYVLPMVTDYVSTILILSPGMIIFAVFESFTRNDDAPEAAMISSIIFNVMNIVWNAVFIFGFGLGMLGAALATASASLCALMYLLICWKLKKTNFRFTRTKIAAKIVLKKAKTICEIGLPSFNSEFLYGFIHITFNTTFLALAGTVGVAAFGIVSALANLSFYIFSGIGQGMQPLAGYYYGIKDKISLRKILNYTILTSIAFAIIAISVIFLFTEPVTSVLNTEQDPALTALAITGARIYFTAFAFVGITISVTAFLSVTGAPKTALVISVLQNGVLVIPLVLVMSAFFGIYGAWAAYPVAELLLVVVSIFCLIRAEV